MKIFLKKSKSLFFVNKKALQKKSARLSNKDVNFIF